MFFLAVGTVGGQLLSLRSLVGFNEKKTRWEAMQEKRDRTRTDLANLQKELVGTRVKHDDMSAESKQIGKELATVKAELQATRNRLAKAQQQEAEALATTTKLISQAEVKRKEIKDRRKDKAILLASIQRLKATEASLRQTVDAAQADSVRFETTLSGMKKDLAACRKTLGTTQKELLAKNRSLADLQESLRKAMGVIRQGNRFNLDLDSLRNQKSGLTTSVASLEERKVVLEASIKGLDKEYKDLLAKKKDLQVSYDDLDRKHVELVRNHTKLKVELEVTREQKSRLISQVQTQEAKYQTLKNDIKKLVADKAKAESITDDIKTLEEKKSGVLSEIKTLNSKLAGLEQEHSSQENNKTELVRSQAALKAKVDALQKEEHRLARSVLAAKAELKRLKKEIASLAHDRAEVKVVANALHGLKAQKKTLVADISRLESTRRTLNQAATQNLEAIHKSQSNLSDSLAGLVDRIGKLVGSLQKLQVPTIDKSKTEPGQEPGKTKEIR